MRIVLVAVAAGLGPAHANDPPPPPKPAPAPAADSGHAAPASEPPAPAVPAPPKPEAAVEKPATVKPAEAAPKFTRRQTVIDETTGMAIGGFDPVAYFVDGKPAQGVTSLQVDWHNVTWLFANEGNLAAFKAHPEVYAPAYGGFCAYSIGLGYAVEGLPVHWALIDNRLFLFASGAQRAAFLTSPPAMIGKADARWPDIAKRLP